MYTYIYIYIAWTCLHLIHRSLRNFMDTEVKYRKWHPFIPNTAKVQGLWGQKRGTLEQEDPNRKTSKMEIQIKIHQISVDLL